MAPCGSHCAVVSFSQYAFTHNALEVDLREAPCRCENIEVFPLIYIAWKNLTEEEGKMATSPTVIGIFGFTAASAFVISMWVDVEKEAEKKPQ